MKRRNMDTKVISASCLVAMAAVLARLIYKMATDFRWFMTISTGMLILYIIGTMAIEIGLYYIVLAMKDIDDASSLADSIKSGNWEAVGKALGDKINSALGSIDWSSVQKKCNSIAEKIADFLNGAVEETDWNLVGSTLGNGINTILGAINTFQKKFDFKKWGESLAETLNSTLSTTDWSLAGDTLGTAVQNVIDRLKLYPGCGDNRIYSK